MKTLIVRVIAMLMLIGLSASFARAETYGQSYSVMSQVSAQGATYGWVWTEVTAPNGTVYQDTVYYPNNTGSGNHSTSFTMDQYGTWTGRQYSKQGFGGSNNLASTWYMTVAQTQGTITLSSNPSNGGTTSGGGTYNNGDQPVMYATPAGGGWKFNSWRENGSVVSYSSGYQFAVSGDRTLVAYFDPPVYWALTTNQSGGGGTTGGGSYLENTWNAVNAYPNTGWYFSSWSDGGAQSHSVYMDGPKSITAYFGQYSYTLSANASSGGWVSGGGSYTYGQWANVQAYANYGYYFSGFSDAIWGSTNPQGVYMDANKSVYAQFYPNTYQVYGNVSGSGSISGTGGYTYTSSAYLTATPATGYYFAGWSGALSGTGNGQWLYVDADKSVTATFYPNTYSVSTATSGSGSISGGGNYTYGQTATLTANPSTGYYFTGWSGALSGATNPQNLVVDGPKSVTANFAPYYYVLNTSTGGTGSGSVTPSGSYPYGTVKTLTATAATGSTFTGWSGAASGSTNPINITVDSDKAVQAHFGINRYTVTTATSPAGIGTVSGAADYNYGEAATISAPAITGYTFTGWSGAASGTTNPQTFTVTGNASVTANYTVNSYPVTYTAVGNGGISGAASYTYGQTATFTAYPSANNHFVGWSGDVSGTANPTSIVITAAKSVTATFAVDTYTLTTATTGTGSVTAGGTYNYGTVRSITATPGTGQTFTGWSGAATGTTNPINITVDSNKTLTATFTPINYTITANAGTGGTITGGGTYAYGAVVTMTATPNTGYAFSGWSGALTGMTNPQNITVDSNKTVSATFTPINYTLTATAGTGGSVTGGGTYAYGSTATLTATASTGYTFANYTGAVTGSTNPQNLTITGNASVTANFTINNYTLTTATSGTGTVTAGGTYAYGTVRSITATPGTGQTFTGWSGAATGTTNPVNITIDANKTLTANFSASSYTVTTATSPSGLGTVSGGGTYTYNQTAMITAPTVTGYTFSGFTGAISGSTNPQSFSVTGNASVTANYVANSYTVTTATNPAGLGTVAGAGPYTYSQTATITAPSVTGYTFTGFTGALTGSTNPGSFSVSGNAAVTANYSANLYNLSVTVTPAAAGSVTGAGTYQYNQSATLIPASASGYYFGGFASTPAGFSGAGATLTNASPSIMGTVTQNVSVTASFMPQLPQNVTVSVPGIITPSATGFQLVWSSAEIPGNSPSSISASGAASVSPTGLVVVSAVTPTPILTLTFPGNTFYLPATAVVPLNVVSGGAQIVVDNTAASSGAVVSGAAGGASAGAANTVSTAAAKTTIANTRAMIANGTKPTTSAPTTVTATASSTSSTPTYTANGVTWIWDSTIKRWVVKQ